jgi:hypothetical protein
MLLGTTVTGPVGIGGGSGEIGGAGVCMDGEEQHVTGAQQGEQQQERILQKSGRWQQHWS